MSIPSTTARFRRQHAELGALVAEVLALLEDPVAIASDAQPVRSALSVLAGKVKVHAAMEDEALYPRLFAHTDPAIRDLARRFRADFGGVYAGFIAFLERWNGSEIEAHSVEFALATQKAMSALGARVRSENEELYARVDEAEPQSV